MKYNFTNNNTITIKQTDYKGQDRHFNYGTGYDFIPLQTTMMIADAKTFATGALSGTGYLYVGCSDVIPMSDLKTICAYSDQPALKKQFSKLNKRKQDRLLKQVKENAAETYNICVVAFLQWLVDNDLSKAIVDNFFQKSWKDILEEAKKETDIDNEALTGLTEAFLALGTGQTGLTPNNFGLATLNPVRNYEAMTDAKLMFFLDNIKGNEPTLLCVVYSEKENYYGLDDINYYEFSYLPNAITSVLHPQQQGMFPMWKQHLKQRLKGAILRVESKKVEQNGQDIQIVTDVLDYCNGYVHCVAHHQDIGYEGIKIMNGDGEVINAPKNQYRWWVPLDQAVVGNQTLSLLTSDFGTQAMDNAFLLDLHREEMLRSSSVLLALLPCGKNRSKSNGQLWDNGQLKPEIRK